MSYGVFQRILAVLERLSLSPEQLVKHLEFMAEMNGK